MKSKKQTRDIDPKDLPQSEVFTKKEVYQYPQPAGQGKPLKPEKLKQKSPTATNIKEENKTSKQAGLNEEKSKGKSGAFEGLEDASKE